MYKIFIKILKRIALCVTFTIILTITNCYAATLENETQKQENNIIYKIRTYVVSKSEEQNFINSIENSITIDGNTYNLKNMEKDILESTETISIETIKTITTKSKNKADILNKLPTSLEYNENGFKGEYRLNEDSLKIKTNYNGFTEYLVEENVKYTDLERNDLDYIPKQITKDNMTLDLLDTTWEVQSTKMLGTTEVPDKYIANCRYATKTRKDNPYTYTITATYNGTADKTEENTYEYLLTYQYVEPKATEEKSIINYIPIIAGSSSAIIIIVVFFIRKKKKQEVKQNEKNN